MKKKMTISEWKKEIKQIMPEGYGNELYKNIDAIEEFADWMELFYGVKLDIRVLQQEERREVDLVGEIIKILKTETND